jgi:hypothetical protein
VCIDILSRRRFVEETICRGDVLSRRRFVCAPKEQLYEIMYRYTFTACCGGCFRLFVIKKVILCILIRIRIGFSSNDLWIRIYIQNPDPGLRFVFRILIPDPRANSDEEIVLLVDFFVYLSSKKFSCGSGSVSGSRLDSVSMIYESGFVLRIRIPDPNSYSESLSPIRIPGQK